MTDSYKYPNEVNEEKVSLKVTLSCHFVSTLNTMDSMSRCRLQKMSKSLVNVNVVLLFIGILHNVSRSLTYFGDVYISKFTKLVSNGGTEPRVLSRIPQSDTEP